MAVVTAGPVCGTIDRSIKDVKPPDATCAYACPEQLRSLQFQFEGAEDDEDGVMINGCLADMWSFACVLYQLLTGVLPFWPDVPSEVQPPSSVSCHSREQWLLYETFANLQDEWVSASLVTAYASAVPAPMHVADQQQY